MKPSSKQISDLQKRISRARKVKNLSYAEIAEIARVHASQVSRICAGNFKTLSNSVVQVCKVLRVKVPKLDEKDSMDVEWAKAHASLRRIWDGTPEGAATIRRMLDAIADLRASPTAKGTRRMN